MTFVVPLLAAGFFAIFYVVGASLCVWSAGRPQSISIGLLQPVVGLGILVTLGFLLNGTLGVPVERYGSVLWFALIGAGVISMWLKRQSLGAEVRLHRGTVSILGTSVSICTVVLSMPSLRVGTDWLSYGNEDWINYVLGAERLRSTGLNDDSKLLNYFEGTDYTQAFWFLHSKDEVRPGAEQIIALFAHLLDVRSHQVYMALMISLSLMVGVAVCSLLATDTAQRNVSGWMVIPVVLIPSSVLAVTYQLIAQVGGVALAVATATSISSYLQQIHKSESRNQLEATIRIIVLLTALIIFYPEILPFVITGALLLAVREILRQRSSWRRNIRAILIPISGILILTSFLGLAGRVFRFFVDQVSRSKADSDIFPYFLKPLGLPAFWGMLPIWGVNPSVPSILIDLVIVTSLVLFVVTVSIVVKDTFRGGDLLATWYLPYLVATGFLFWDSSGFGLFKITMWQSPFLTAMLVSRGARIPSAKTRRFVSMIGITLCIPAVGVSATYLHASFPGYKEGLNQVSAIDSSTLRQLTNVGNSPESENQSILIADDNPVSLKIATYLLRNSKVNLAEYADLFSNFGMPSRTRTSAKFGPYEVSFPVGPTNDEVSHVIRLPSRSVINQRYARDSTAIEIDPAEPYLTFVPSSLGEWWSTPGKRFEASYAIPEPDPYRSEGVMQSFRRFSLFRVENAPKHVDIRLSMSSSFLPQHLYKLPSIRVFGANSVIKSLGGAGSASVLLKDIEPLVHKGSKYVLIEFGMDPKPFPEFKFSRLSQIYGSNIRLDPRTVSTFVRDISVSKGDVRCELNAKTVPPLSKDFGTCFSGVFEDRWMSSHVQLEFAEEDIGRTLRIKGTPREPIGMTRNFVLINNHQVLLAHDEHGEIEIETKITERNLVIDLSELKLGDSLKDQRVFYVRDISLS